MGNDVSGAGRLEVLVEPFRENEPGPHVVAVLDLLRGAGLDVDMGPFSTTAEGPLDVLTPLVSELLAAGFAAGATSIQARVERI